MNNETEFGKLVPITIRVSHPKALAITLIWSLESKGHLHQYPMPVATSNTEFQTAGTPMTRVGRAFECQLNVPTGSHLYLGYWLVTEKVRQRKFQWTFIPSRDVQGQAQIHLNPLTASGKLAQQAIRFASRLKRTVSPAQIPPENYPNLLINETYRYVYGSIPKNGCSSLKFWFLQTTHPDRLQATQKKGIHTYMRQKHSLTGRSDRFVRRVLKDNFAFTISRNPWSRVVSAYLNKFGAPLIKSSAYPVIDVVHNPEGNRPYLEFVQVNSPNKKRPLAHPTPASAEYSQRITFREFVDYLCRFEDEVLNTHWRPQWRFLQGVEWDYIGRLETLEQDIQTISRRLNIPEIEFPHRNRTAYAHFDSDIPLADVSPSVFIAKQRKPHARQLWTPELIEKVAKRYEKDIQMFGYNEDYPKL